MNEIFDKLILRIVFTVFICLTIVLYKYAHKFLYPSSRKQLFKRFYPSKNSADTLHLFARLIGIGIVFSEFYFYISDGIVITSLYFVLKASMLIIIYLASMYIIDSIVLYNFEYADEILKKKNFSYAIICFAHAIAIGYILKSIMAVSGNNPVILLFLWLFSMVIIGFASKSFSLVSKMPFNRLLIQKSIALALSYCGFLWGWTVIVASALNYELKDLDIRWYGIQVILNILLSAIIFPIFKNGLVWTFQLQEDIVEQSGKEGKIDATVPDVGHGIYEGSIFFTSCFLTSVITGHIHFGTFYPVFGN